LLKFDSIAFRDFEYPSLPPEEMAHFSEVLLNIFEAELCQDLARVVQKVDNAIHRINNYPVHSVVCFVNVYPLDSDLSGG